MHSLRHESGGALSQPDTTKLHDVVRPHCCKPNTESNNPPQMPPPIRPQSITSSSPIPNPKPKTLIPPQIQNPTHKSRNLCLSPTSSITTHQTHNQNSPTLVPGTSNSPPITSSSQIPNPKPNPPQIQNPTH